MSRRARDVTRQAAGQGSARLRDQPAAATRNQAEPRAQRILDLQRTAGNAAVVRPSTIAATKARELTHRAGLLFSRAQAPRRLGGRRDDAIKLYEE